MMPGNLQPLGQQFPIVNPDGTPTLYFIEWAQQKQIDISAGITAAQAQQLIDDWAAARSIIAGAGLDGGGALSADVTIDANASAILDLLSDTQGTVLYRGASAWAGLAPGTSGHFLKTNGAGANPAWAAGGGGGNWWFNPPSASAFSLMTSDGATNLGLTDDADAGLLVDSGAPTSGAGTQGRFAYVTLTTPASAWDLQVRLSSYRPLINFTDVGIFAYNSSNGRHIRHSGQNNVSAVALLRMSAIATFSATQVSTGATVEPLWRRIVSDGTNIVSYVSCDGKAWVQIFTETLATYLTAAGGSVDRVGFFIGLTRTTGARASAVIESWSLTGPGV